MPRGGKLAIHTSGRVFIPSCRRKMGCSQSSPAAQSTAVQIDQIDVKEQRIDPVLTPLFFPDVAMPCRNYMRGQNCRRGASCKFAHEDTSLVKILRVLDSAVKTLDVCVFTITCNELADAIESAAHRGVAVRIISDDEQAKSQGSDVARLAKNRQIAVRHDGDARSHMHHKFAIVDGSVLINGSFNWTRSAVITNRENVVIASGCPVLASRFLDEFDKMWSEYARNTRIPQSGML